MWDFFKTRKYLGWSFGVGTVLLGMSITLVMLEKKLNFWFGTFYDNLQMILAGNAENMTIYQYYGLLWDFMFIALLIIFLSIVKGYLMSRFAFAWRTSMTEKYHDRIDELSHVEGASQRIQEDTIRFARLVESIGDNVLDAVLVLVFFLPLLIELSIHVIGINFLGHEVPYPLLWIAVGTALVGTLLLSIAGRKLVGVEFDLQKYEASYRKHLVKIEDGVDQGSRPKTLGELYEDVRKIHFKSYLMYMKFNFYKYTFSQAMVIVPYVALAPTILSATITLGVLNRIIQAFNKIEQSFLVVFKNMNMLIELASVYKRLRTFEKTLK